MRCVPRIFKEATADDEEIPDREGKGAPIEFPIVIWASLLSINRATFPGYGRSITRESKAQLKATDSCLNDLVKGGGKQGLGGVR